MRRERLNKGNGKGRRICFPIVIGSFLVVKLQIWGAEPTFVTGLRTHFVPGHTLLRQTILIPTSGFNAGIYAPRPHQNPNASTTNSSKMNDQTSIKGEGLWVGDPVPFQLHIMPQGMMCNKTYCSKQYYSKCGKE